MICLDKLGREITVGAFIVYGHALGRCAGLQIGKVLALKSVEVQSPWNQTPRTEWRITVIGLNDHSYGNQKPPTLNSRKGTLQSPERIIVLDELPAAYKTLLEGYQP